jgi:hypothetical protein
MYFKLKNKKGEFKMSNNLDFKCEVILDNKFKKISSDKIVLKEENYACFNYSICENGIDSPIFNIIVRFENDDSDQTRATYLVEGNDITLMVYNIHPNPNNEYIIFSNKKEIIEIDGKKYYIEPSITVYPSLIKQVNLDLYEEIN